MRSNSPTWSSEAHYSLDFLTLSLRLRGAEVILAAQLGRQLGCCGLMVEPAIGINIIRTLRMIIRR